MHRGVYGIHSRCLVPHGYARGCFGGRHVEISYVVYRISKSALPGAKWNVLTKYLCAGCRFSTASRTLLSMPVLQAFATLLLFQLAGELLHALLHLPLPGPVLGMALLTVALLLRKREPDPMLLATANRLLSILGLLFVPAGVGIITNLALLRSAWLPLTVSMLVSSLLTLVVTAGVMHMLLKQPPRAAA